MTTELPGGLGASFEYDVPRGTCPRCDSRVVRHLIIGMLAGPESMEASPEWVSWVGCVHPGFDRQCEGCDFVWSASHRPSLRSEQVAPDDVGAWIFKCDPGRWDPEGLIDGSESVDSWSISESYRQHLLVPGQRAFLYVNENDRGIPDGIYGIAEIVDDPFVGVGDERWVTAQDQVKKRIFVPLDMPSLRLVATGESLRAEPALAYMELFVAPSLGNPVLVRPQELAVLEGLCSG